jgi:uncharacterized surface protein with fasciclin (FAS1) repeats
MLFHVVTIVWGEHHTDLFLRMTLPNVLSPGNLPALASAHDVRYRIFTTHADRARIEAHPHGHRLAEVATIEFVIPLGERQPDVSYHVHWFHRSAAEAKRAGAIAVFVPPDTLWSDGTFRRCGEIMAAGKKAIAVPFLQVVAETCIPEALERFGDLPARCLTIPPAALVDLALRHMHPLTTLATPGSPHARPALDMHWPVPGQGILSRFAVRELFALDPQRATMTFLWYAGGAEDIDGIHFANDSDDMVMLSVDPLAKYVSIFILDHTVQPADIARSTLHPLNDTEQTRGFARHRVRWHNKAVDRQRWSNAARRSDVAIHQVIVHRLAMRLWAHMKSIGCHKAAGLLAVAMHTTQMARRLRKAGPLRIYVPTDKAFAQLGAGRYETLLRVGNDRKLIDFLLAHVAPHIGAAPAPMGSGGNVRASGNPHRIDGLEVQPIDKVLGTLREPAV